MPIGYMDNKKAIKKIAQDLEIREKCCILCKYNSHERYVNLVSS